MGRSFLTILLSLACSVCFATAQSSAAQKTAQEFDRALNLFDDGKTEEAVFILERIDLDVERYKRELPEQYYSLQFIIGGHYLLIPDFAKARKYFEHSIERFLETGLPENENLASLYETAGGIASVMSDYVIAERYILEAIRIYKDLYGEQSQQYLSQVSDLATNYRSMGQYKKAMEQHREVEQIWKIKYGTDNAEYINALSEVGKDYYYMRDFAKSLPIYEQALKMAELVPEISSITRAGMMSDVGQAQHNMGHYDLAMQTFTQALAINNGSHNPQASLMEGAIYSNLASLFGDMGDYPTAIEYRHKAIKLLEAFGGDNSIAVTNYNGLGLLYFEISDLDEALKYFLTAAEMMESLSMQDNPDYANILNSIAQVLIGKKEHEKASQVIVMAFETEGRTLGKEHPAYPGTLEVAAAYMMDAEQFDQALAYLNESYEIHEKTYGANHPYCANILANMGSVYTKIKDYSTALDYQKRAHAIYEKTYSESHRLRQTSLSNIGFDYMGMKDYDMALDIFCQHAEINMERVKRDFALMTERERNSLWTEEESMTDIMFFINTKAVSDKGRQAGYNTALFSKGLLLNSSVELGKIINESGNPQAIATYAKLKDLKGRISALEESPDADRSAIDSLQELGERYERELLSLSKEYGSLSRNLNIDWRSVQQHLGDNEVAVEFVRFVDFEAWDWANAAFVLRKGWARPEIIFLFHEKPFSEIPCGGSTIKELMAYSSPADVSKLYSETALYDAIWKPLEKYLKKGDRVYFSAAGMLHNLCIEYLPVADGAMIYDRYDLRRLSSTKLLAMDDGPVGRNASTPMAVLYGGLDYNSDLETMLAYASEYEYDGMDEKPLFDGPRSARGGAWSYLSGTREEVTAIDEILSRQQITTQLYTGEKGIEESIKGLSGKDISILHIATHGFYIPLKVNTEEEMNEASDWENRSMGEDPMSRSGLVFSGANNAWLDVRLLSGIEDGILTSKEIAGLDFRKLGLVVLSACQTGLGDIAAEGVYGLQRAFKIAGAQTLVMSLWEVSDDATRLMMTELYDAMSRGASRGDAFRAAQQKVMQRKYMIDGREYNGRDPYFWAGFIMLD